MTAAAPLRVAQGLPPRYFRDPDVDRLWSTLLALAGEVAVLRDRLDAHERLAGRREAVDAYAPDPQAAAEREAERDALVARVLAPITLELEALKRSGAEAVPFREEE
jgi:hypothetical protein